MSPQPVYSLSFPKGAADIEFELALDVLLDGLEGLKER
jgi:hypothetical protein